MTSLGCCTGEFDTSVCASEAFILAPNGGGVATASNSRYGLGGNRVNPQRSGSFVLVEGFVSGLFKNPDENSLEAIADAWMRAAPLADTSLASRWCLFCWNLLGEPAMPVWVPSGSAVEEAVEDVWTREELGAPTVLRGPELARMDVRVLDIQGRDVSDRRCQLAPGVYFIRGCSALGNQHSGPSAVLKVVVAR